MKKSLILMALLAAFAVQPVRAQSDLSQDQVAAYVTLVKADRARNRGALNEALAAYREAQQAFQAIARKDPRWQPEVVKYRLAYCENEIEKLSRPGAGGATSPASAAAAADQTSSLVGETTAGAPALRPPAEPDPALQAELEELRRKVSQYQGLAALTGEVARLQQEQAAGTAERQRLQAEVDQLRAASAAAAQPAEPGSEMRQLEKDNERLRDQVADLEKALEKARETKVSARELKKMQNELADLQTERDRLQEQLKEARAAADRPSPEQERLADQLRDAEEKLSALSAEKKEWDADLKAVQDLAESRFQELADTAQRLENAQQQVAALKAEQEQAANAMAGGKAADDQAAGEEVRRLQAERAALEGQLTALSGELEQLRALARTDAAAPAAKTDWENLQRDVSSLGEQLRTAGQSLDAARDAALGLIRPTGR